MKNSISVVIASLAVVFSASLVSAYRGSDLLSGGFGFTNAPTDGFCGDCHTTGPHEIGGELSFSPALVGNRYVPGTLYTITFTVPNNGEASFGFELTAFDGSNNDAGVFTITDASGTRLLSDERNYVSQAFRGVYRISWPFDWTAPSATTGAVTFYMASIGSDGNEGSNGDRTYKNTLVLEEALSTDVAIADDVALARGFRVEQNYPNPFNPNTKIKYSLSVRSDVSLTVYNVLGEKVKTLKEGSFFAGVYSVSWDSKDSRGNKVASGIYFYSLRVGNLVETRKMILLQ